MCVDSLIIRGAFVFYSLLERFISFLPVRYLTAFVRFLLETAMIPSLSVEEEGLRQRIWGLDFKAPLVLSFPTSLTQRGMSEVDSLNFGAVELQSIRDVYAVDHPFAVSIDVHNQRMFKENAPYVDMMFIDTRAIDDTKVLKQTLDELCMQRRKVLKEAKTSRHLPALIPLIDVEDEVDLFEKLSACLQASVDGVMIEAQDQTIASACEIISIAYQFMGKEVPVLVRRKMITSDELSMFIQSGASLCVIEPEFFPAKIDLLDRILLDFLHDMHNNNKNKITEVIGHSFEAKDLEDEGSVPEKMVG